VPHVRICAGGWGQPQSLPRPDGVVSGYVISGFLTTKQLRALREIVDSPDYERSKKWRGEFQEMAKAIIAGIDKGLGAAGA